MRMNLVKEIKSCFYTPAFEVVFKTARFSSENGSMP